MDEDDLDRTITNEDPGGYQAFIGTKNGWNRKFNTKKKILGSFVLLYSRLIIDSMINAAYGENRFNGNITVNQIYYGTLTAYKWM